MNKKKRNTEYKARYNCVLTVLDLMFDYFEARATQYNFNIALSGRDPGGIYSYLVPRETIKHTKNAREFKKLTEPLKFNHTLIEAYGITGKLIIYIPTKAMLQADKDAPGAACYLYVTTGNPWSLSATDRAQWITTALTAFKEYVLTGVKKTRLPRKFGAFGLLARGGVKSIQAYYKHLPAFAWDTACALFALTDPNAPAKVQKVTISEIWNVIRGSNKQKYGGFNEDYIVKALYMLLDYDVNMRFLNENKARVDIYSHLQYLGMTFIDDTGEKTKHNIRKISREAVNITKIKNDVGLNHPENWKLDKIRFQWSSILVNELIAVPVRSLPGGYIEKRRSRGWIEVNQNFTNLRAVLRKKKEITAGRLLNLLVFDVYGTLDGHIEKAAPLISKALGYTETPNARQKERIERAIRVLIDYEVLYPNSDVTPRKADGERRKADYYVWRRAPEYSNPHPKQLIPRTGSKTPAYKYNDNLFGSNAPHLTGAELKEQREAAGINLRDFAKRFKKSIRFWSEFENEIILKRTGEPRRLDKVLELEIIDYFKDREGVNEK